MEISTIFGITVSKEIILAKDEFLLLKDLPSPNEQSAVFAKVY
jgi:hypothetical protein